MKNKIGRIVLGFYFIVMVGQIANAQFWHRTNPGGGGWMMAVGAGPSGTILVGSDLSGAYRSIDNGQSWDVIGARNGLTATHVGAVGFDSNNDQVLFLGTNRGIYRSTDGGDSVVHVYDSGNGAIALTDIEISSEDSNIGYATYHPAFNGTAGMVLKTVDNGVTWDFISQDLPENLRLLKLVLHPSDPEKLFVLSGRDRFACSTAKLYRSENGGENWSKVASAISDSIEIMDVAISPSNPDEVYLTTMNVPCGSGLAYAGDLYKSIDGGDNWSNPNSLDQEHSGIIWLSPTDPNLIKLIDVRKTAPWIPTSGTFSSTDGGQSWTKTGNESNWEVGYIEEFNPYLGDVIHRAFENNGSFCQTLGTNLSDPNSMFWVNKRFVYGTQDGGTTFKNLFTKEQAGGGWQSRGIENVNLFDIEISEVDPNIIYAGYADNGLWRSLDGGASWESCNHPDITDGWDGFGGNAYSIAVDPVNASTVWASIRGTNNCHLVKSTAFGEISSWVEKNSGLPVSNRITDISLDRNSDVWNRTIYCVASNNIYKSINDGDDWTVSKDDGGVWFVEVDPHESELVYAGGSTGFFKSTDGGSTWIETGLAEMSGENNTADFYRKSYRGVSCIHPSHCEPGVLFVAAYGEGKGLYKSEDYGTSWTKVLNDNYMRTAMISEVRSEYVFAGSSFVGVSGGFVNPDAHGMYVSPDYGENWMPMDAELIYPSVIDLESTHQYPEYIFAISQCTGIQSAFDWLLPHVFYEDADNDGFGNPAASLTTCSSMAIAGYVADSTDCDDNNEMIYPGAEEIPNNGIDENCDDEDLISNTHQIDIDKIRLYPNPVDDILLFDHPNVQNIAVHFYSLNGNLISSSTARNQIDCSDLEAGIYIVEIEELDIGYRTYNKVIVE